jgi:hypothetical protein
MSLIW